VNLLFNQTTLPTNGPPPDYQLLSQSQGGPAGAVNSTFTLSPVSTPPIVPGATYILGIQNTNSTNVSFTLRVDFDVTAPALIANVPGLHLGLNGSGAANSDAFLTKLSFDSLGISNIQSVLFGGTGTDIGWDVAVETNSGNVYVIGSTMSPNFPTTNTVGLLTMTNSGHSDVFVTVVSNDMSGLVYSAYLGGRQNDFGYGVAVAPGGDAYIVGRTLSKNFPTVNPFMTPLQLNNNGFVAKIQFTNPLVSVTIQTAPVNLQVLVDGVTNVAPVTFTNWILGSTHTISTLAVQGTNGVDYVWTNWSDGGTLTHTVVPLTNLTITAGFQVLPTTTVAVVVDGKGSVSPNLTRNTLQAGHSYTVTGKPAAGNLFWGWSMTSGTNISAFITNSQTLTFVWQPGLVLQASFIVNPFIPLKGNFAGLFFQTNEVLFQSSGYFTETLENQGTFSGKIILAGKGYSFSGRFTTNGTFSTSIRQNGAEVVSMSLQLNFGDNSLSGELSNNQFVAELQANRKVFASTNPAPQSAFRYTVSIPGSDDSTTAPGGSGYGTVTVNNSGNLQFSGTLGDGTKVSQGTFVSADGQWPLYSTLYSQKGSILGFLTFTNEPTDDLSGLVNWFKPPVPNSKLYPGGFTIETNAFGSIYSFFKGIPVLNFSPVIIENGVVVPNFGAGPGQVVLEGGGLTQNITNNIILGSKNLVTNEGPNKMSMSINTSSGLFHGNIVDPATHKSIVFNGAVLQKTNIGAGTFLGTTQSGQVLVTPQP
jgi:hypothetical protein